MTALPTTVTTAESHAPGAALAFVRFLLLVEALATFVLAIFLSLLATGQRELVGGTSGEAAETMIRFAAAGAFLFAVAAGIAARGVRRRRAWAWTTAAVLQLLLAVGTGVAVLTAEWHPAYLAGFALPGAAMLVLCLAGVRRALGQD
jgi:hypothetical protein